MQLGKKLAAQRKQLRLHRHPFRTLYYFSACAASAAVRGSLWLARHRITLTLLLPAVAGYIFLKQTGNLPDQHLRIMRLQLLPLMRQGSYSQGSCICSEGRRCCSCQRNRGDVASCAGGTGMQIPVSQQ